VISFDYASRQLAGVWRMAWNQPDWTTTIDRSVDGVFRSFWAIAFAAPVALAGSFCVRRAAAHIPELAQSALLTVPLGASVMIEMIAYVAGWFAGLATLIFAVRSIGAAKRVGDVIIGYNWLQVFAAAAQLAPLAILSLTRRSEVAALFALPALVIVIALYWGMLRRSSDGGRAAVLGMFVLLAIVTFLTSSIIASVCLALYKALS
jgi:hypothetical protein